MASARARGSRGGDRGRGQTCRGAARGLTCPRGRAHLVTDHHYQDNFTQVCTHRLASGVGDTCPYVPRAPDRKSSSQNVICSKVHRRTSRRDHLNYLRYYWLSFNCLFVLPFLREVSHCAHLKHSTWKTQCRAFMTRSLHVMSPWHRAHIRLWLPNILQRTNAVIESWFCWF